MLELRVLALAQEWEPERALERAQVLPLAQQVLAHSSCQASFCRNS